MNKLKNIFIPRKENNYSPIVTKSVSIFIFALSVLFFNISYSGGYGQVRAAISIGDIVSLHNQEREARGLGQLTIDPKLNYSAQKKAEAMLSSNCWSHYCPEGKSPWDFFDDAGYTYIYAGENLAHGFYDSESAMIAWMNSPTHRANVLKTDFNEIGIGVAYGDFQGKSNNIVITVHFGSEATINNNVPVVVEQPTVESPNSQPKIISPEEGAFVNNNLTSIVGDIDGGNTVEIYNRGSFIGEVPADGGIFTYRPEVTYSEGEQTITIKSLLNGQTLGTSEARKFTVDTQNPFIVENRVEALDISTDQNKAVILSLSTNEKIKDGKFRLDGVDYEFLNSGDLKWKSEILLQSIENSTELEIILEDLAGNKSTTIIERGEVLGLEDKITLVNNSEITISVPEGDENLLGLSKDNLKSQVNLTFILISIAVILIDIIAARQTGLTGFEGKSHFHFSNFAILILVILIGGLNGQLLEGINISL